MDFSAFHSPLLRWIAWLIAFCHLAFALYVVCDRSLPRRKRWLFALAALLTGPFLFGRWYFKQIQKIQDRQLTQLRASYRQRRGIRFGDDD